MSPGRVARIEPEIKRSKNFKLNELLGRWELLDHSSVYLSRSLSGSVAPSSQHFRANVTLSLAPGSQTAPKRWQRHDKAITAKRCQPRQSFRDTFELGHICRRGLLSSEDANHFNPARASRSRSRGFVDSFRRLMTRLSGLCIYRSISASFAREDKFYRSEDRFVGEKFDRRS